MNCRKQIAGLVHHKIAVWLAVAASLFVLCASITMGKGFSMQAMAANEPGDLSTADLIGKLDEGIMNNGDTALIVYADVKNAKMEFDPSLGGKPTPEQFIRDLKASYNARGTVVERYSGYTSLPEDLYQYYRFACVEAERPFFNAYQDAYFDDRNYQVLCKTYLRGLNQQFEAERIWMNKGAMEDLETAYFGGYTTRAEVLVELSDYYEAGLDYMDELREVTRINEVVEAAKTYNLDIGATLVTEGQENLNRIGFNCGTADGMAGIKTVLALCHYQQMKHVTVDGKVTEEIAQSLREG